MAILGISGKINSGKDTVAKIIQYLSVYHDAGYIHPITEKDYNSFHNNHHTSDWQIVKFADALKDIVCILTGCTRKQLEDIDFKNSKLPDEWIRYGYADGFFKYYKNGKEETKMNNVQCSKERYELEYKTNWETAYKVHPTYRELLQYIGTDLLRNQLHSDAWINALMSQYKSKQYTAFADDAPIRGIPTEEDEVKYGKIVTEYPNWIITDVRFPNEAQAIKDRGGFIIRVNRNWGNTDNLFNQHPSETALDDYNFDYTIDNNSSIDDLIIAVNDILVKANIIT